ncbi:MAG: hypothetical protein LC798_20190 [Chloroflexi bacterium]|nr:hypothetical protein [Chloroflexota bacterium]
MVDLSTGLALFALIFGGIVGGITWLDRICRGPAAEPDDDIDFEWWEWQSARGGW